MVEEHPGNSETTTGADCKISILTEDGGVTKKILTEGDKDG